MSVAKVAALVAAIEAIIDERVDQRLAALGVASTHYSTSSLPPHTTARTFARWCREGRVADAMRDGAGWRCSAAAWREARAQGPKSTPKRVEVEPSIDAMIAAAGLRATRGTR